MSIKRNTQVLKKTFTKKAITSKVFTRSKGELAPSTDTNFAKNVKDINLYSLFYPKYSWKSERTEKFHTIMIRNFDV